MPNPGLISGSIEVDGVRRTYDLYVPSSYEDSQEMPLVIALHPFASTGGGMARMTNFNAIAEEEGFIVAYPDGRTRLWNGDPTDEPNGPPEGRDDVAFIDALISKIQEDYTIDASRVYATGASNGALMAQRLGCDLTERFAAIASVMITLPVGWEDVCEPSSPLPILLIQSVDDPFFPWEGGTVQQGPFLQSEYGSAPSMVQFWVDNNAAVTPPVTEQLPDTDPADGTTIYRETYAAGQNGAEVVFYGVNGGGHTWPGSTPMLQRLVGVTSKDMDASRVIWDFFAQHAKKP
ncbi:MAG: hypothetical protein IT365_01605 [Candidatus Hydrogenedentes bacterium]|nr:hypothetical protein [Candidatus Hydrogenedentota bacterium]